MFIRSTGSIIKLYLLENDFTFSDLAHSSGVSLRNIYRLMSDEIQLSYEVAKGMNSLIPEISIEFLMVYDTKYQIEKQKFKEKTGLTHLTKYIDYFELQKLYPEYKGEQISLLQKGIDVFGLDNLINFTLSCPEITSCQYSKASGSKEKESNLWLFSTYKDCLLERGDDLLSFDENMFNLLFNEIRNLTGTTNINSTIDNMKRFCNKCGINFYHKSSIPNSRIKAVTVKDENNRIFIFTSDLFKNIENLWLSFVHEAIHIKNKDYDNSLLMNKSSDSEILNEKFISEESIKYFIGDNNNTLIHYNVSELIKFAKKQRCSPGIIAEIYRFQSKIYNNSTINSYIHYYDSSERN